MDDGGWLNFLTTKRENRDTAEATEGDCLDGKEEPKTKP
jgi:hypothetical protein